MKILTIPEHTKVYCDSRSDPLIGYSEEDGCYYLPEKQYEMLYRYDSRLAKQNEDAQIFNWSRDHFKAGAVVGVLQFKGLTVEILPKTAKTNTALSGDDVKKECNFLRQNLLFMLSVAGDLPVKERDLATLDARPAPLSDVLIRIFAERLMKELQRGLDRGYVIRQENLQVLKGKLMISKHVMKNVSHKERFMVQYQDFISDTPLNRIFKAACSVLYRQTTSGKNQQLLRFCQFMLDDTSEVQISDEDFKRIIINRQNERFEELLNFCRLILAQHSPTASRGKEKTFSLLFNMNEVFEGFISQFLKRYVVPRIEGARVTLQGSRDVRHLLHPRLLRMKPDITIDLPGERVIIDTKWKIAWDPSGRGKISSADGYQLYAYSYRFDARRCILLYPEVLGAKSKSHQIMELPGPSDRRISMVPINLERNLRTEKEQMIKEFLMQLVAHNVV